MRHIASLSSGAALLLALVSTFPGGGARPAVAQANPGAGVEAFGETVDVHLVTVEVSVKAFLGERNHMEFTAEDFEIYEDGEPRPITHFERMAEGQMSSVVAPVAAAGSSVVGTPRTVPRSVVLAFDLASLRGHEIQRVAQRALHYVETSADPTVRWAIVTVGPGSRVLLPFTAERPALRAVLNSLTDQAPGVPIMGWGVGSFIDLPEPAPEEPLPTDQERFADLQSVDQLIGYSTSRVAKMRAHALFDSLRQLLQGWSSLEGAKDLVMFYRPGLSYLPPNSGRVSISDLHQIHEEVEDVARWAAAAGFSLHALDAGGLSNPAVDDQARSLTDGHTVPQALAVESGGRHLALNDLGRGLDLATDRSRNHYRLSFQVARAADGREHEIEVKLRHPGLFRVRHPTTYLDLTPRQRLLHQLATSANIPKTADRLPVALVVRVLPERKGRMPLHALLSVPAERLGLLWDEERRTAEVEFFLAVYDARGELMAVESERRSVEQPATGEQLSQVFSTELPAGNYTIAMEALDTVDGNVGMDYAQIHP